jgi:phage protein D
MPALKPTFSLNIGSFTANTDNPAGGPRRLIVERDMDIPLDAARLYLMDRSGIALDDKVVVRLGHDGQEETVFTGTVAALRPAIAGVEIRALGLLNGLTNLRRSATYEDQTAGRIANDLIGQAGLSAGTVDEGPTLPRYAVDSRLSAFAHLKELANRLGYELYADRDGHVMFHGLGPGANLDAGALGALAGAAAGLTGGSSEGYVFGQHLLAASANRQPAAWSRIEVGGESPMSGHGDQTAHWLTVKDQDYRGAAGDGAPSLLVLDPAARTQDLANRFAAGYLAVAARTAYQIRLTVLGRPQLDLGDSITASDVPDALINGSGYVRAIRHRFGAESGYLTDMRVSVDASA